ncbi:MAG: ABC transporter permease [Blautia sp.]|nr:ABC transporter permease [Blautia sp.]MCM1201505.1 ABC transporter permease [Bacteroides fragilis]
MNFSELLKIEFLKVKRSRIVPLIFLVPLLVAASGAANLRSYFSPEYTNAWAAMFIQSALVYAYYLLPFSMIVVCTMIEGRETGNHGILKMLTLPVSRRALSAAKFCILLFYLLMETVVFFTAFAISGSIAVSGAGITEALPAMYLLKWCAGLFLTVLPAAAVIWAVTVLFEKPLLSTGLNLLLVIPGVLIANTPLWIVYPYCYSGYLVSCSLHDFTAGGVHSHFELFPFLPCAVLVFVLAFGAAVSGFGNILSRFRQS